MEEQEHVLSDFTEPQFKLASVGQRFLNFIIDLIAFYFLAFIAGILAGAIGVAMQSDADQSMPAGFQLLFLFSFLGIYLFYYTLLEGAKGKTLGKLLTKTKAVQIDGSPLGYQKAFVRSLCRFVPFEFISVFFGGFMWHDRWTYSMTVQDN
ncbi:MAG: RDD family protein [Lacibacter sp.]